MENIQLQSFHVKDYRSIRDTKKIEVNDKVTILAGKNESGKTNVLNAILTAYNGKFQNDDVPVNVQNANPTVKLSFRLNSKYIEKKLGVSLEEQKNYTMTLTRSMSTPDIFEGSIIDYFVDLFIEQYNLDEKYQEYIRKNKIKKLVASLATDEENTIKNIEDYFNLSNIGEPEEKEALIDYIKKVIVNAKIREKLKKLIPKIVYFDSFTDILPDELTNEQIQTETFEESERAFMNLLYLLGISKKEFINLIKGNERNQSRDFKRISNEITNKYNNVYMQEKVSIGLYKNGNKIFVQIFNEGDKDNDIKPSQRSKGFQWFIAFYLLLNSIEEDKDAIILIDEPGLYLHATAQDDVLRFLNNEIDNQVLFTTHSPYLLDINKLNSLKLVVRGEAGTNIVQKYYDCKDQETITPLITAIGYNISKNPIELGNGLNIITEGISDRFYLLAFLKLFNNTNKINVIPSTGSQNIHLLVSLCIGWGLDYKILLDNDDGATALEKIKELYTDENEMSNKIIFSSEAGAIENVFSANDKSKFSISKNNKVTSSYNFYSKVTKKEIKKEDLEEDTIANIRKIINKMEKNAR